MHVNVSNAMATSIQLQRFFFICFFFIRNSLVASVFVCSINIAQQERTVQRDMLKNHVMKLVQGDDGDGGIMGFLFGNRKGVFVVSV
jgi:hypothetical protein